MKQPSSIAVCVSIAALSALVPAAAHAAPSRALKVTTTESGGTSGSITFDKKDRPSYRGGAGGGASAAAAPRRLREVSTEPQDATAAADSNYTCVNNRSRKGFVAYEPVSITQDKKAYYLRFRSNLYKQNKARRLKGASATRYSTKQLENCIIGGGQGKGGNRLYRVVASMSMFDSVDRLIGFKWDKGKEKGNANASLTFSIPTKPVTIGGSLDVHPTYTLTGSQGPDEQANSAFKPYVQNQVNALWEGSHTFRTQGSNHFQGNVGHGLWELPQSTPVQPIKFGINHKRFCGHLYGIGCA